MKDTLVPEVMKTREVAEKLRVSSDTVIQLHKDGVLPGVRLGKKCLRFKSIDVDRLLDSPTGGKK